MLLPGIFIFYIGGQECTVYFVHICFRHNRFLIPFNIWNDLPPIHYRKALVNLKSCLTGKGDNTMDGNQSGVIKYLGNGFDMALILPEGISKFVFVAIDVLGPHFTVLAPVNPAFVILRFNDKNAIDRYNDVINLCTMTAGLE